MVKSPIPKMGTLTSKSKAQSSAPKGTKTMAFNAANFATLATDTSTAQVVYTYDGGADTDSNLKSANYFPQTTGAVKGDVILAQCTHGGVAGKVLSLVVTGLSGMAGLNLSEFYQNF